MIDEREKELIIEGCRRLGLDPDTFEENEYGETIGTLGRWTATEEIEGGMIIDGDEGNMHAVVVGSQQHGNEHVAFYLVPDEADSGAQVEPFENVQPA